MNQIAGGRKARMTMNNGASAHPSLIIGPGSPGFGGPGGDPMLGEPVLQYLVSVTGLLNEFDSMGIQVVQTNNLGNPYEAASADYFGHEIRVPGTTVAANSPQAMAEILAHENGHMKHPANDNAKHTSETTYVNHKIDSEGWGQVEAIREQSRLADKGYQVNLPVSNMDIQHHEEQIYDVDAILGGSPARAAHDIGKYMKNHEHPSHSSQTYGQHYSQEWRHVRNVK
jgi:hypothetical protein